MTHYDKSPIRHTSVTIRQKTRQSLQSALARLNKNGFQFSEQRLMRECLRLALRFWRGRKDIAKRNRRYNKKAGIYEIVPFYTTEALRSASWARCHHAGISLSRVMDFAVCYYLNRVVERWLSIDFTGRDKQDVADWAEKFQKRLNPNAFVISYVALTHRNNGFALHFDEKTEILPWPPPRTPIFI